MFYPFIRTLLRSCNLLLLCGFITALTITGCGKSAAPVKDKGNEARPGHIAGMGPSTDALQGKPFHFSDRVDIKGGIKGISFVQPGDDFCQSVGSGTFVLVSLELVNNTGKDTLLIFPAGLTFESRSLEDQNGLLIQEVSVHLAKGATCNTLIYAYCINEHRNGSSQESQYDFGPVSQAAPIREFIELLARKKVNLDPGESPSILGVMGSIQEWVWLITDGEGLTESEKQSIAALEDKKNT